MILMTTSAEKIFENVIEDEYNICRRCFKPSEAKRDRDSLREGPSCGEDCGAMSATLEKEPIDHSKIESRAPRLLSLVQSEGYTIDKEAFSEAIDS